MEMVPLSMASAYSLLNLGMGVTEDVEAHTNHSKAQLFIPINIPSGASLGAIHVSRASLGKTHLGSVGEQLESRGIKPLARFLMILGVQSTMRTRDRQNLAFFISKLASHRGHLGEYSLLGATPLARRSTRHAGTKVRNFRSTDRIFPTPRT